jgi:PIN domain nuclease of toxin-antitoxin system
MSRLLLDTHVLLWLLNGDPIRSAVTLAIHQAQKSRSLYVSPVSAWEVGVALGKENPAHRPNLNGLPPSVWFKSAVSALTAKVPLLNLAIAVEAAAVPAIYGHGDPGDCFLIATARVCGLALVTHDSRILDLAARDPSYLTVIVC